MSTYMKYTLNKNKESQDLIHDRPCYRISRKINRSSHRKKKSKSYSIKNDKTFGTKMSGNISGGGRYQVWWVQGYLWGWGRVIVARGYSYSGYTPK